MNTPYRFPEMVAWRTVNLLFERKALLAESGIAFYVWQRPDRLVLVFDPNAIDTERVNDDFAHRLSSRLNGRRVVRTNSRGLFLQVGFEIPSAPVPLESRPLDLTLQPSPWHMPIGMTANGPLWISLLEADSILIGGSRGTGKTGEEHAGIQALLHGARTLVYGWDGKRGAEFGRYIGHPNFHFIMDAGKCLREVAALLDARMDALRRSGYPNIQMYNEAGHDFIEPVALFVDEIADLPDAEKVALQRLIEIYRAAGLHPVLATNRPTQAAVLVKTNLSTRICFRVPSFNDSITMLGAKGAELLSQRGRGLIDWKGRLIEFQSFTVDFPKPSEQALRELAETPVKAVPQSGPADEIAMLAESIRSKWSPEMSGNKVASLLGKPYGGSWYAKVNEVVKYLKSSSTTSTGFDVSLPENGLATG